MKPSKISLLPPRQQYQEELMNFSHTRDRSHLTQRMSRLPLKMPKRYQLKKLQALPKRKNATSTICGMTESQRTSLMKLTRNLLVQSKKLPRSNLLANVRLKLNE
jgi:hypothetical protein